MGKLLFDQLIKSDIRTYDNTISLSCHLNILVHVAHLNILVHDMIKLLHYEY